jgi:hypothetical protein
MLSVALEYQVGCYPKSKNNNSHQDALARMSRAKGNDVARAKQQTHRDCRQAKRVDQAWSEREVRSDPQISQVDGKRCYIGDRWILIHHGHEQLILSAPPGWLKRLFFKAQMCRIVW